MEVVLELSHLFETFVISSYPNFSTTGRSHTRAMYLTAAISSLSLPSSSLLCLQIRRNRMCCS